MQYRINKYNKNYIMIDGGTIIFEIQKLQTTEKELSQDEIKYLKSLWYILDTISCINQERRLMNKEEIKEIAINKKSDFFKFLLTKNQIKKPKEITLEQIIHASLISIERQEWHYYYILSNIIVNYGIKNIDTLSYNEFLEKYEAEITEYIVNSGQIISNINYQTDDRIIYLYSDDKLQERKVSKDSNNKAKIRTK